MTRSRSVVPAILIFALLGFACGRGGGSFRQGAITPELLKAAVSASGFEAAEVEADIPKAIRPVHPWKAFSYDDSLLAALRESYDLEGITAGARDEWQAQLLLKAWVNARITNGTPTVEAIHATEILNYAAEGKQFWCTFFAITYIESALALGWQARKVILDHYHGPEGTGSQHHGAAEVWSNQFRKWVFIDPQSNLHFEKDGRPLSAWEIRAEWLKNGGADVDHVVGVPPQRELKNPAIVWWKLPDEDETALFFWLAYYDNYATWEADSPSKWLFPQDSASAGKVWYQNDSKTKAGRMHAGYTNQLFTPIENIDEVYWTVGVVEAKLVEAKSGRITLSLDSYCPDFEAFEADFNAEEGWLTVDDPSRLAWRLHKGTNELSLRTRNTAGVTGPETTVRLQLD